MLRQESFDLWLKQTNQIESRESRDQFRERFCGSPLYDPQKEPGKSEILTSLKVKYIDREFHRFLDEGNYPKIQGYYHLYHRIDGKLVGVSAIDILNSMVTRQEHIWDTSYDFLNLRTLLVIKDIEYVKTISQNWNKKTLSYHMGEIQIGDPDSEFAAQFGPGTTICKVTKKEIDWEEALPYIIEISQMTVA